MCYDEIVVDYQPLYLNPTGARVTVAQSDFVTQEPGRGEEALMRTSGKRHSTVVSLQQEEKHGCTVSVPPIFFLPGSRGCGFAALKSSSPTSSLTLGGLREITSGKGGSNVDTLQEVQGPPVPYLPVSGLALASVEHSHFLPALIAG